MTMPGPPSFEALYNRYRPQRFGQLVGQPHVVRILQNALAHNRLSHAYLFSGERGTGKTTAARLLAKAVNCLEGVQPEPCDACDHCRAITQGIFVDLVELDAASHSSVDDVRELREQTQFAPAAGRYKVYIVDEVHQLSTAAKDALLKTLEEPPARTLFILATTEPHKVPATIRSRCQHLTFRRISDPELVAQLSEIAESEGTSINQPALNVLARNAAGSLRDAISLLDQALAFSEGPTTLEDVSTMLGLTGRVAVVALAQAVASGDAAAGLNAIERSMADGNSPVTLRAQVVDLLREVLLVSAGASDVASAQADDPEIAALADRITIAQVVRALEVFAEPEPPSRGAGDPTLELELAFARAVLRVQGDSSPTRNPSATTVSDSRSIEVTPEVGVAKTLVDPNDFTADTVKAGKEKWIAAIRRVSPVLAPYVEQGEVLGYANDVVKMGYRNQLLFEQAEKLETQKLVAQALSETFGRNLTVDNLLQRGVTQPRKPPPAVSESEDPVVRVAMREYGAEPLDGHITEEG